MRRRRERQGSAAGLAPGDGEGDVLDGITSLVDNNLLRQTDTEGEPRFGMLETVREFALSRLEAGGEASEVRHRHADYYVDYSHGIRLIQREVIVDGKPRDIGEVLKDKDLSALLSDEGPIDVSY